MANSKKGSNAPRPRTKFKDTLHNLEWLKTNWLDCLNESEVGRRADASPHSANKALQKLFDSDPSIPRFKTKEKKIRVRPFQARPGRRTNVEPTRAFQYQESARIFEGMDKTCALCGDVDQYKKEVNHKDRSPWNNNPSNLESLCVRCHRNQHHAESWLAIEFALKHGMDYMALYREARKALLEGVDIKDRVMANLRPANVAMLELPIYYNREWLIQKYVVEGHTTYDMAEMADTSQASIMRRIKAENITRG